MINAIATALAGMQTATSGINKAAENIAKPDGLNTFAEDAVNLKLSSRVYEANLAVIETVNETQEELLNTFDETV